MQKLWRVCDPSSWMSFSLIGINIYLNDFYVQILNNSTVALSHLYQVIWTYRKVF